MFHVEDYRPEAENVGGRDLICPAENYGVKLLSIGFFTNPGQAIVWRGGMASNAIKQLINDGNWGNWIMMHQRQGTILPADIWQKSMRWR